MRLFAGRRQWGSCCFHVFPIMRVDHCHCHRSMQPYYFLKEKNHKTYNYSYSYLNISSFHQPTCFLESFQVGRGPSQLKGEQCSQIYWREPWMYNPQLQHYPHSLVLLNIQCQYYRQYYYWLNTWFSTIHMVTLKRRNINSKMLCQRQKLGW